MNIRKPYEDEQESPLLIVIIFHYRELVYWGGISHDITYEEIEIGHRDSDFRNLTGEGKENSSCEEGPIKREQNSSSWFFGVRGLTSGQFQRSKLEARPITRSQNHILASNLS